MRSDHATAVTVEGVSKSFWHRADRPRTWKETALGGFRHLRTRRRFSALKDVTFDVTRGSTLGFVGPNGAGKSTLLRLIGGVGHPDEGRIDVRCRIGAITELGTGFHPDLSGRESAMLAGVIGGLTRRAVAARLDDIISFAELEEFIDEPVRTYSSGMVARLSFAIATNFDAELLLIDEVLAVGDIGFQQRCVERLKELQRAGVTMIVVSHDPELVTELCDQTIWLRAGRVVAAGPPNEIARRYEAAMGDRTRELTPTDVPIVTTSSGVELRIQENRFGSQEAHILDVRLEDAFGRAVHEIRSGEPLSLVVETSIPRELGRVNVALQLVRSDGVMSLDVHHACDPRAGDDDRRAYRLDIGRLDLGAGDYAFDAGIYSDDWERPLDFHWRAYPLRVSGERAGSGMLAPPLSWSEIEHGSTPR